MSFIDPRIEIWLGLSSAFVVVVVEARYHAQGSLSFHFFKKRRAVSKEDGNVLLIAANEF